MAKKMKYKILVFLIAGVIGGIIGAIIGVIGYHQQWLG